MLNNCLPAATNIEKLLALIKKDAKRGSDLIRDFAGNEFLESSQVVLYKERVDIRQKIAIMMEDFKNGRL